MHRIRNMSCHLRGYRLWCLSRHPRGLFDMHECQLNLIETVSLSVDGVLCTAVKLFGLWNRLSPILSPKFWNNKKAYYKSVSSLYLRDIRHFSLFCFSQTTVAPAAPESCCPCHNASSCRAHNHNNYMYRWGRCVYIRSLPFLAHFVSHCCDRVSWCGTWIRRMAKHYAHNHGYWRLRQSRNALRRLHFWVPIERNYDVFSCKPHYPDIDISMD